MCNTHYKQGYRQGLYSRPTAEDRFWQRVEKGVDCWTWIGGLSTKGYGRFWDKGRHVLAHRFAYELLVGAIPDELTLDHRCHTRDAACKGGDTCPHRSCVNPEHLLPMTSVENAMQTPNSPTVINARKRLCVRGHPLSGGNLVIDKRGGRQCKECRRAQSLATYHRRRAQQKAEA